jgi:hypothetical protein
LSKGAISRAGAGISGPGLESIDPGPESGIGRGRRLRLQPNQVLDHLEGGALRPLEEVLPRQEGAVEGAGVEYVARASSSSHCRGLHARTGLIGNDLGSRGVARGVSVGTSGQGGV